MLTDCKIDPNYKKKGTKKAQDEISEISAQSDPTQYGPTFWRPALVACAINSLTDFFNKSKAIMLMGSKIDPNYKKVGTKKAQDELASFSAQYSNPTQYGPTFWRPVLVACAIDSLTDFFDKSKGYSVELESLEKYQ